MINMTIIKKEDEILESFNKYRRYEIEYKRYEN